MMTDVDVLDDRSREILDFEKLNWKYPGSKNQAIRERFGMTPTNYYQLLNRLIDRTEALEYAPQAVNQLRTRREQANKARQGRNKSK